jgi:hypothetical protein
VPPDRPLVPKQRGFDSRFPAKGRRSPALCASAIASSLHQAPRRVLGPCHDRELQIGESSPLTGAVDRCSSLALCWLVIPYGGDSGGCVPHGDLAFVGNYWPSAPDEFSTICPTSLTGNLIHLDNHRIAGIFDAPTWILRAAGRQRFGPR